MNDLHDMEVSEHPTQKLWHDPAELKDRLNQPKVTYEEALEQTRRMMSAPNDGTLEPLPKKEI